MTLEKYISKKEDYEKTESMMTDQQRLATEIRERLKIQEMEPFEDFAKHIDDNYELRKKSFASY